MTQRNTITTAQRLEQHRQKLEQRQRDKEQRQAQREEQQRQYELELQAAEEQKYAALKFKYSQIEDEAVALRMQDAALKIRQCERRAVQDLITIGEELQAVKALMPDKFTEWIAGEFGYSNGSAHDFMNMAKRHAQFPNFGNLGISSARLLSAPSVPDAAIAQAIEIAETKGKITLIETREIIHHHKPAPPKQLLAPAEPEPAPDTIDAEFRLVQEPMQRTPAEVAAELTLPEILMVLELAKEAAKRARQLEPSLDFTVTDMLPSISRLIHRLEGLVK